jgi:hypothetical protein
MLLAKQSVQRVVVLSWVALLVIALALDDWRLESRSRVSMALVALACFIVAGVTLAMLVSHRARRALAAPEADVAGAWFPLFVFCCGFCYVGGVMLVSALR